MSESRKLPVPNLSFGLGARDVIMTSSESRKLVFLLWVQSRVMETFASDSFSWGTTKTIKQSKLITMWRHTIVGERLWLHQTSKIHFCGLVFQVNLQRLFLRKINTTVSSFKNEWKYWKYLHIFNLKFVPSNQLEIIFLKQIFKNKSTYR